MGLTDLQIKKLIPKKTRFEVSDGKGLSIHVTPQGTKTWVFRYQFNKIPRRMTLGRYPGITFADARKRHAEAMQLIQNGIDPGKKKQEEKNQSRIAPTFKSFINEFWEKKLKQKKSGTEILRLLQKDAVPLWNKRKVAEIKRRDIVLLLDRIEKRGAPITRNRVLTSLKGFFKFAINQAVIEDSPCINIDREPEASRTRVLNDAEIKLLWEALDLENKAIDIYRVSKLALKMILLTGQRPGEVCSMTWAEIDNEFWNIPPERMKNGMPHRVPLNQMACDVIEQARIYSGKCDFVFESSYKPGQAIGAHSLSRAIVRHWSEFGFQEAFVPHDLRRTLRTKLAELSVSDIIAERVLGHKLQGVLGIYNRHSYDVEKRQALALWERRLGEILGLTEPISNVIPFEARHA